MHACGVLRGKGALAAVLLVAAHAAGCGGASRSEQNVARLQAIGEQRGGTEDEILFAIERLEAGDAEERTSAAWALGLAAGEEAVPALLRTAREDPDLYVRVNAVTSLGQIGGDGTGEALTSFLEQEEPVQAAALKALGHTRYADDYASVGRILAGGNPDLRALAADALGRMGNAEAIPQLQRAADDPDKGVRNVVAFALGKLGDPRAIPILTPMLGDDEWEVRANAAQALGMIGDPSARPALERMGEDPSGQVRTAAQRALDKLG